ncbi:flagellin [Brevundimonas sp.]|uniref:flagellin n=1 Tax=Brevundimonas sp. TaxID=1871086 RepID=UPI0025DF1929|nr:flagellin [Brevundimonas sp.]
MALNSVNTNAGAMIALQNLQRTNSELATVQDRINTGRKVNSAKDNGAVWAIAQSQRAEVSSLNAVKDSLQRGQSAVDVAISAGESISDLLIQLKEKALAAKDTSLDTAARTALNEDFKSIRDQIAKVVSNAEFNGVNMLKSGGTTFKALANADGSSTIDVAAETLKLSGAKVTITTTEVIDTVTKAGAALTKIDASIANVSASLARLGTGSKSLETHLNFVSKLQDTLEAGVGNLVDADLAKESARLQALQTKQQLGVQALSIANTSSSILLGLFR